MRAFDKLSVLIVLALFLSIGVGTIYGASKYPEKPITLVVHMAPGGGSDIFARTFVAAVEKYKLLPQTIAVENKPGGGGAVAFAYVAGKRKDPYYLLTSVASLISTPLQGQSPVTYKDFTPICNFAFDENLLLTSVNSKYKTLKDVVADAKANPEKITVSGTTLSGPTAMCTYQIEKAAGIKLKFVTFSSGGDASVAVLGGHVDLTVANPGEALELVKANKLRVLGAISEKRLVEAPDIPTLKEQGLNVPGTPNNRGFCAPGGIPEDARKVLEEACLKYTKTDVWKKFVKETLLTEAWMDGPRFGKWMGEQTARYAETMKEMGILKK